MAGETDDPQSPEARAIRTVIEEGVGLPRGSRWTNEALGKAVGCSAATVSGWRKGNTITAKHRPDLLATLWPGRQGISAYRHEYDVLSGEFAKRSSTGVSEPVFSKLDAWNMLLRPLEANVERLVTDAGDYDGVAGLELEHLSSHPVESEFYVPAPEWFAQWAGEIGVTGKPNYEIRAPRDLRGDSDLAHLAAAYPDNNILELIRREAESYAHEVTDAHTDESENFPFYNKPKLGLLGWRQPIPANSGERANLCLSCYQTDYFTHRVMRRVMRKVRAKRPEIFESLDGFPNAESHHQAYFTTSIGLNAVTVTNDPDMLRFQLSATSRRIGNSNQRGKWHVSVSEGLSVEDVDPVSRQINFERFTGRALSEELGVMPRKLDGKGATDPIADVLFLEFSFDLTNFEPFLSCVVFLNMTTDELVHASRTNARDRRREIAELESHPFTASGIVDTLLKKNSDTGAFTSFSLQILDLILEKGLAS